VHSIRRVIIVGAGLGGLATAIALRRKGFEVEVYEQAPALGEIGAGVNVGPNAVKAFRVLGLAAELEQQGFQPSGRANRDLRTGRLMQTIPLGNIVARFDANFILMHRADLLGLLANHVPASLIHLDHRCVSVEQDDDSARATFANGCTATGDLIIGCDGIRSVVRQCLFGAEPPLYTGNVCWRATVPTDALPRDLMDSTITNWYGQGAHVTGYYIRKGAFYNLVAVREVADWTDESWVVPSSREELLAAFPEAEKNLVLAFQNAPTVTKWGQFDREPLAQWTIGRITLMGDAAHPMLPALGQGAATAFEDACVLAEWADRQRTNPRSALASYEAARKPRTSRIQVCSRIESKAKKVSTFSARLRRGIDHTVSRLFNYRYKTTNYDWIYQYDPARDWNSAEDPS
jgi:salicylate hydroxylase